MAHVKGAYWKEMIWCPKLWMAAENPGHREEWLDCLVCHSAAPVGAHCGEMPNCKLARKLTLEFCSSLSLSPPSLPLPSFFTFFFSFWHHSKVHYSHSSVSLWL